MVPAFIPRMIANLRGSRYGSVVGMWAAGAFERGGGRAIQIVVVMFNMPAIITGSINVGNTPTRPEDGFVQILTGYSYD